MKHTLLIHLGMRKTGTTALQMFLYENMKTLEKYGWCYPDLKPGLLGLQYVSQNKENGCVFYKEKGKLDVTAENWNRAWAQVLQCLKKRNVIISDERISIWDTNRFLIAAKEKYDNIKILIYLRRQDRAVESLWNQKIKNAEEGVYQSFDEFLYSKTELEEAPYYQLFYKKQLDDISKIVGKENIIVRVFEKEQLYGMDHTIESDFLNVIGIKSKWNEWEKCNFQNIRMGGNYLEIKRIFNSLSKSKGFDIIQGKNYECLLELSSIYGKPEQEKGCFKKEERKKFLEIFENENEEIAREYLDRKEKILFYDKNMDYPLYNHCTEFEEDMIRVFASLIYNQSKELRQLKRQNSILSEKIMLSNMKEKKLLFFGAGYKCRKLLDGIMASVELIVDNDLKKRGETIKEVKVVHIKDIERWTEYFVVVTCDETKDIESQLIGYGLKKGIDYVLAKEYFVNC